MPEGLSYFELRPHVGAHPDEQLQGISAPVLVPTMVGREIGEIPEVHVVRPLRELGPGYSARVIPETRIVEVRDHLLRGWFENDDRFQACDPPTRARVDKQQRAAREYERAKNAPAQERAREKSTTAKEQ